MNTPTPDPRALLVVPWVVAEPDLVRQDAPGLPLVAEPEPAPVSDDGQREPRPWPFLVTLAASVIWCIVAAALTVTGAIFPIEDNLLAYLVIMAGLFCAAFGALTCPRPEEPETFWTWGREPVGQCTPSRNTLTGRGQS